MPKYRTNWHFKHDGVEHPPGAVIELDEAVARPNVGRALSPLSEPEPRAPPEPPRLDDLTVVQLRQLAQDHDVELPFDARKADIVATLEAAGVEPE